MVLVLTWFLCSNFTRRREAFTNQFDIFLDFGHTLALVAMLGALLPVKEVLAYGDSLRFSPYGEALSRQLGDVGV